MCRILFLFLLLPITHLFPLTLSTLLSEKGKEGDTIIVQYSSVIYGIRLHLEPSSPPTLFIAKAPLQLKERERFSSWIDWMDDEAKGAVETLICPLTQLKNHAAELDAFFSLQWTLQHESRRKKRGAPPLAGEFDFRPLWQPKIVIEGTPMQGCLSDAYEAVWPEDGSELAKRILVAYVPLNEKAVPWFPYWVELSGGKQALFVVDSKKGPFNHEQP